MRNRKDGHIPAKKLIHHRVWKMPEVVASSAILVFEPISCRVGQTIDGVEQLHPERIGSYRALLKYQMNASRATASASGSTSTSKELTGS